MIGLGLINAVNGVKKHIQVISNQKYLTEAGGWGTAVTGGVGLGKMGGTEGIGGG